MFDTVVFSSSPGKELSEILSHERYSKVCLLVDENTRKFCYSKLQPYLPAHHVIEVMSGEAQKNLETCGRIWQAMTDERLDRHAVLIVLGGGVLGDMGGFCAATYKRGIDFILVPTTLLAQVDASVGGKLGVDFNHYKNHIGVFQLPRLTLVHTGFLETLPVNEMRSGYAEVIKHTLIADDAMWREISKKTMAQQDWPRLIEHSVSVKRGVVEADPKEAGLRKILNAGHTIGHAVETYFLSQQKPIMHGEAVAAGLVMEAKIAFERGLLKLAELREITTCILSNFPKLEYHKDDEANIAALTLHDKKNKGDKILCVLLDGIGKAKWDFEITEGEVKEALSFYRTSDVVHI